VRFMHFVHLIVSKLSSLSEITLALLDGNLLGVDSLDLGSTWSLIEVLNELVERALIALCFTDYLFFVSCRIKRSCGKRTVPSELFFTKPVTPRDCACSTVNDLKLTPWTEPSTR